MSIIVGVLFILGVNPTTVELPGWSHFATQEECYAAEQPIVAKLQQLHPDKHVVGVCLDLTPKADK